jgi:hypothetical protein
MEEEREGDEVRDRDREGELLLSSVVCSRCACTTAIAI